MCAAAPASVSATPPSLTGTVQKRCKTPTRIQIEAVECGAVALAIILQFYGKRVSIEEMRSACDVSRSGVNALKMLKAARSYGMEAQGWKQDIEGLFDLHWPCILFWNFSHFVVLEGIRGRTAFINDPATGPRKVPLAEFERSYTGIVLTLQPGPNFQPGGDEPSLWEALRKRLPDRSLPSLGFLILAGLGIAFLGLVSPAFQHVFVDDFLIDGMDSWVKPLLWIMLLAFFLVVFLQWLQSVVLVRLSLQLAVNMEGRFLWHLLHLPLSFFTQRFAGELTQRALINDHVAQILSGKLARTTVSLLTIIPYAFLLFTYNWLMAAVGLLVALLNVVAMRIIARVRTDTNSKLLQDRGVLTGTAVVGFQNMESIKATASEDAFFARLAAGQAKVISGQQRLSAWSLVLSQAPALLNHLNNVSMLTIGGLAVMDGQLTIGYLLAFQGLMRAFTAPFAELAGLGGELQEARGEITRLDDVLAATPDPAATLSSDFTIFSPTKMRATASQREQEVWGSREMAGHLEVRGLTFGYSRDASPLIDNLSFVVPPGARLALVGASGCGKSTIVQLMVGLLEPWSGEVLFDGKPRSAWSRRELADAVGYVSQTSSFFEGTILENLTLFDSGLPLPQVLQAVRDACADAVIGSRAGGYLAPVGEGGRNFSGGQCQRLEIARALTPNPRFLFLDEATSALDPATEMRVDENLRQRGITTVISAHRLCTIREAEEIVVLDRGRVMERGRHDELLARQGLYHQLVNA